MRSRHKQEDLDGYLPYCISDFMYNLGRSLWSNYNTGENNWMYNLKERDPKGYDRFMESHKEAMSDPEYRKKMSKIRKGKPNPKHSEWMKNNNPMKGKRWSMTDEQKERVRAAKEKEKTYADYEDRCLLAKIKSRADAKKKRKLGKKRNLRTVICPHCGKVGKGGAMTQFHFDNCKHK